MQQAVTRIVVVGGGTAGWLVACRIAARLNADAARPASVTLVESPDVATVGVGEGTWPTIRNTLSQIGMAEEEFLLACDASFKQGSRFLGWRDGEPDDVYLHPFSAPVAAPASGLVAGWHDAFGDRSFADAVGPQARVCAANLAPRQRQMPPYAAALNYAYHLDAAKLAALLSRHGTERLGVRHIRDHVDAVEAADNGDIAGVRARESGTIAGDLFIDCTGHAALLIGGHYGVGRRDCSAVLFNDSALVAQVPVAADSPIASQTDATAHTAGWIWDIGLPTRRGVGCVYASAFMEDAAAEDVLRDYLVRTGADEAELPGFRKLSYQSGHRERFWEGNCLAIGLSAGFLEPLEASAIVLIELSIDALLDGFPVNRDVMAIQAERFNRLFAYRWDRIIDFLKLHYVPSQRRGSYWRAHRDATTIPDRLRDLMRLWRYQPPSPDDFAAANEIFPAASYQYVLYGMGVEPPSPGPLRVEGVDRAVAAMREASDRARALTASLPTNRAYLDALRAKQAATNNKEAEHHV